LPASLPDHAAGARQHTEPKEGAMDTFVTVVGNLTDDPELRFTVGVRMGWLSRIWAAASRDGPLRAGLTFEVL
jgi:hypothetical protein